MENNLKKFQFRVVVKTHDPARLITMLNEQGRNNLISPQEVAKLFTSINEKKITALVKEAARSDPSYQPPNFLDYYSIDCNSEEKAERIVSALKEKDAVKEVSVEVYSTTPPSVVPCSNPFNSYQQYLNAAPVGIDARYAWKFPGGDGSGKIKFVDIEQGWVMDHEDVKINQLPCTGLNHYQYEDHGLAVLGVIMMLNNEVGGIGITPNTHGYVVSQWRPNGTFNTADAIMAAIDHLNFGDILLLEAQNFDALATKKIWPVEVLEVNFQLIRLATALGIVVIEAAGNGMYLTGSDLDNFTDNNGNNIFDRSDRSFKDSGAILVAAASSVVPHRRINYSNYGSRIDCYAWGENVVTAGNYPGPSGLSKNSYTHKFCGTSSAAAIIAGAAISIQNVIEKEKGLRMSPAQMREILSNKKYGTKSKNGHQEDKIGVMPDLKKIIDEALQVYSVQHPKITTKQ